MRYDMAKVLIEGPRTQSGARSRKWGKKVSASPDPDYDYCDEIAGKVSSARRRQYGYDYKHSTDVLGPLKGYLRSKVGQPWDKVYSEICANLDKRKTTGAHVFTHIWQFVAKDCWIGAKTGNVYRSSANHYGVPTIYQDFYIHPFTGILCKTPEFKREWKKAPVTFIELSRSECYVWIKGIWYFANWAWITEYIPYKVGGGTFFGSNKVRVYSNKRQLSKKELRDLKLSNKKLAVK